jgi:type IV secretion system protein VirB6
MSEAAGSKIDLSLFRAIGSAMEEAIRTFVEPGAARLIDAIEPTAVIGITLYFTLMGYLIMTGYLQRPFFDFLKQAVKIILVAAFALNIDGYAKGVLEAFNGLETGLTEALTGKSAVTVYEILDSSVSRCFELSFLCFEKMADMSFSLSGWFSALGWYVAGIIIAISGLLMTVLGGATFIVAKFSIAVMFAIGPLFILCLLWPVTAKFFDSWFRQVMSYLLTIVFIALIMSFAVTTFEQFTSIKDITQGTHPMLAALKMLGFTLVLLVIIAQAGQMAAGLSSGISSAAFGVSQLYRGARTLKEAFSKKKKN